MRFLITLARAYPLHSIVMITALLLAGVLVGIGLSMLLPVLNIAVRGQSSSGQLSPERTGVANPTLEYI